MDSSSNIALWLVVWIGAASVIVYGRFRNGSIGVGLVLAYVLNLWLIHWLTAFLYLRPEHQYYDRQLVERGFEQSAYGMLAFAFASVVLTPFLMKLRSVQDVRTVYEVHQNLPKAYIVIGTSCYMLLSSFLPHLPTVEALVSVGQQIFVIGLCLTCWMTWWKKDMKAFISWCGVPLLLPFITMFSQGFLGYGFIAGLTVLAFLVGFVGFRKVVVVGLLLGYVALSVYVTYMRDRREIREVVWAGESLPNRLERIYGTMTTFEWFDPLDESHLGRIDARLNQNVLVGMAVTRLSDSGDYAYGETIWQSLLALIPRAVWPEKPIFAGSGDVVSQFTGLGFAEGTSVGVGQVMEFYVNFGVAGVIFGFVIMGVLVTVIDITAGQRLLEDDWQRFTLWYLIGISFLNVGGSLVEVTGSAGASLVVALLINKFVLHRFQRKRSLESWEAEGLGAG
jgi:hypothetical protein